MLVIERKICTCISLNNAFQVRMKKVYQKPIIKISPNHIEGTQ